LNKTIEALHDELGKLAQQLQSAIPEAPPFNIAHKNWSFPGLTRTDLVKWVEEIAEELKEQGPVDLGEHDHVLADYVQRLSYYRENAVQNIWGSPAAGVAALQQTLDGLRAVFRMTLPTEPPENAARSIKLLTHRLAAMNARVGALEPKALGLEDMIVRIESAHAAADALPEDLKSLNEARMQITAALEQANKDSILAAQAKDGVKDAAAKLTQSAIDAQQIVEKCAAAYSAATSLGLARAFSERSSSLSNSMWFWSAALAASLLAGVKFGGEQLNVVATAVNAGTTGPTLAVAFTLAVLKLGGPVWFAWLATKQIGQRFRLSEDYAFKASISRAYEGYRKEAVRVDPEMEKRLLASALDRLDEQPLRLVEPHAHGSPWHELANSELMKKAIASGPEFVNRVRDLALSVAHPGKTSKPDPTPPNPSAANQATEG
jgi:hypothetical protein